LRARSQRDGGDPEQSRDLVYGTERLVWPSLGSVLLLRRSGLPSLSRDGLINMAHGEMVMIAPMSTFVVQDLIRTGFPGLSTIPC